jgi:hypothetical protein
MRLRTNGLELSHNAQQTLVLFQLRTSPQNALKVLASGSHVICVYIVPCKKVLIIVINIKDEPTMRGANKMISYVSAKTLPIQMCTIEVFVLISFVFLSTPLSTSSHIYNCVIIVSLH